MAIGNSVNDEIREQQKKVLQEQGFKGKLEYFIYYYKWHVIISAIVLLFGGSMIYQVLTQGRCPPGCLCKWFSQCRKYGNHGRFPKDHFH